MQLALAGVLGVGLALLVACGTNSKLIPAVDASQLKSDIDAVGTEVSNGDCGAGVSAAVAQIRSDLTGLPATVDPRLVSALRAGVGTLSARAASECKPRTTGTTGTTPTNTTATNTTSTTNTSTDTTPTNTTTTDTNTTPTDTTTTDTTPTDTTTTGTTPGETTGGSTVPATGGGTPAPNGPSGPGQGLGSTGSDSGSGSGSGGTPGGSG